VNLRICVGRAGAPSRARVSNAKGVASLRRGYVPSRAEAIPVGAGQAIALHFRELMGVRRCYLRRTECIHPGECSASGVCKVLILQ
jgi:hypothetical protein